MMLKVIMVQEPFSKTNYNASIKRTFNYTYNETNVGTRNRVYRLEFSKSLNRKLLPQRNTL